MKITDFKNLINCMPFQQQAFRINKKIWLPDDGKKRIINQYERIKKVFGDDNSIDSIMISRNDLFKPTNELDLFVIQVLMWGYPTKGRGKNIEKMFIPKNFDQTIKKLEVAKRKGNISNKEVEALFSDGLRLSTVSKLLYFLQIKVESFPALILDLRVIDALTREDGYEDDELKDLKKLELDDNKPNNFKELNYNNAPNKYPEYLNAIHSLALKMNVQPDQIEMFLFEFGSNLKSAT